MSCAHFEASIRGPCSNKDARSMCDCCASCRELCAAKDLSGPTSSRKSGDRPKASPGTGGNLEQRLQSAMSELEFFDPLSSEDIVDQVIWALREQEAATSSMQEIRQRVVKRWQEATGDDAGPPSDFDPCIWFVNRLLRCSFCQGGGCFCCTTTLSPETPRKSLCNNHRCRACGGTGERPKASKGWKPSAEGSFFNGGINVTLVGVLDPIPFGPDAKWTAQGFDPDKATMYVLPKFFDSAELAMGWAENRLLNLRPKKEEKK